MKPEKMSLKEIQGVLSRDEMKKIMAGSGSVKCGYNCSSDSDCVSECPHCDTATWGSTKFCFAGA